MSTYFMGQGKVYAALRGLDSTPMGFRLLGNCTRLDISLGRGGMHRATHGQAPAHLLNVPGSSPSFTLDMESIERDNLALLMHGAPTVVSPAAAVIPIIIRKGMTVPLPHIALSSFTALRDAGDTTTLDTNGYTVNLAMGSIDFSANSSLVDGAIAIAKYVQSGHSYIGPFTNRPDFMALRYEGVNVAERMSPVVVDIFKVKFDPMDDLQLINDNYLSLKTQGKIYYDEARLSSSAEGKFMRIRQTL